MDTSVPQTGPASHGRPARGGRTSTATRRAGPHPGCVTVTLSDARAGGISTIRPPPATENHVFPAPGPSISSGRRVRPPEDADRRCVTQVEVRPHPNVWVILLTQLARLRPSRLTEPDPKAPCVRRMAAGGCQDPHGVPSRTGPSSLQPSRRPPRLLGHGPTGGIARPGRTKLRSRSLRDRSPARPNWESPSGLASSTALSDRRTQLTCASWCAVVRPGTTSPRTRCFASRRSAVSDLGR